MMKPIYWFYENPHWAQPLISWSLAGLCLFITDPLFKWFLITFFILLGCAELAWWFEDLKFRSRQDYLARLICAREKARDRHGPLYAVRRSENPELALLEDHEAVRRLLNDLEDGDNDGFLAS